MNHFGIFCACDIYEYIQAVFGCRIRYCYKFCYPTFVGCLFLPKMGIVIANKWKTYIIKFLPIILIESCHFLCSDNYGDM